MRYDFNTIIIGSHTGYGNASRLLVNALENRGANVFPDSPIMLNFCMPPDYRYGEYTIGYTPWESTEVPLCWHGGLRAVDDLWATTDWVATILRSNRPSKDVFVLPHGIEKCWQPYKRNHSSDKFTFIHVGDPAVRKGGDIVLAAWMRKFANNKDVELIYKCIKYPVARVKDRYGSIIASPGMFENVRVIGSVMSQQELYHLYTEAHCMVYPTRGEGFGLIPFEAMATGMPTILPLHGGTGQFAGLGVPISNSMWVSSTAEDIHPGLWLDHDVDEIIDRMLYVMENYDKESLRAFENAHEIHRIYSWDRIADLAIARIMGKTSLR